MEFSKKNIKITKGVAILFMLLLHLFARKEVNGLYTTFPEINGVPLVYYIGLFGDACVPMFCFASGYGLFVSIHSMKDSIKKGSLVRILKLLINYWIVLLIFISIGFIIGDAEIYPGSLTKFLLNFFVLSNSYNGAWWFLQTYIILVLLSPLLFKVIQKNSSIIIIFISGMIYLIAYMQRINHILKIDDIFLNSIVESIILIGTSQFSFIVGMVFANEKIYSKIYFCIKKLPLKNLFCITGILFLIVFHSFFESMIIAPVTGIAFICFFNLIDKNDMFVKILDFISSHSTNIWLTHMFFYLTIFPKLTFAPKYPIAIFIWLIILCLFSSCIINLIYKPLINKIFIKSSIQRYSEKTVG